MSKSRHEQSFYFGQIQIFHCYQIFGRTSVSMILEKMLFMLAKAKIVLSDSQFFVKKQRALFERELLYAKMIYINTKIEKKILQQFLMEFLAV